MPTPNPFVRFWQFSLWFLFASVAIVCFPATLLITGLVAIITMMARRRRAARDARYSWTAHPSHKPRASGYRRARYGRWS